MQNQNNFELVFHGTNDDAPNTRQKISTLLEQTCGFQLLELESTLENVGCPISILCSEHAGNLEEARNKLNSAGAKVLIVQSSAFEGVKIGKSK